ncbi:ATP-grasp fold amidoligase family protein [Sediminicola arcticus]|uniref:ATP-grasp fold amidoligase family protein n=1 Tax=Sediminicola arcticus TaxID=1574308 RepID=A0ABV2SV26_9FLAO
MRKFLKKIYYSTEIGKSIIDPFLILRNKIIPQEILLKIRFKRMLGYPLNLKEPKTFNEKIQWLKLHDRSSLHIKCADKYAVRKYVKEKIGEKYLIPLILKTTNVEDISPEKIPEYPVIIKTNHDSGGVSIIKNKNLINWSELRIKFQKKLNNSYGEVKGEWQYKNITPCIIIEKLLLNKQGQIPSDYKLHCFNGRLVFTDIHFERFTNHKRNLYDKDWNLINCRWVYDNGPNIPKPAVYEEMKTIAEQFAKDFIYVRVDLYVIENNIFFGELTFHAGSGNEKFIPQIWDSKFGNMLQLPNLD